MDLASITTSMTSSWFVIVGRIWRLTSRRLKPKRSGATVNCWRHCRLARSGWSATGPTTQSRCTCECRYGFFLSILIISQRATCLLTMKTKQTKNSIPNTSQNVLKSFKIAGVITVPELSTTLFTGYIFLHQLYVSWWTCRRLSDYGDCFPHSDSPNHWSREVS